MTIPLRSKTLRFRICRICGRGYWYTSKAGHPPDCERCRGVVHGNRPEHRKRQANNFVSGLWTKRLP